MADSTYNMPSPTKSPKGSKSGSTGHARVTKPKPKINRALSLSPKSNSSTESSIQASCKSPQASPQRPQPTLSKSPKPTLLKSPKPTLSKSPKPTLSKSPKPTLSKSPKPTLSKSPKPTLSKNPKPTLSKNPKPTLSKSPKPTKTLVAPKSSNPTMLNMVLEALKNNKSVKGLTLQGMKRYITETYPDTKESFSNVRFRTALMKGLEGNEIIRPKSSEETGVKGHFLFNRALHSQREKVKQQALKIKEKKSASNQPDKEPKKRVPKVAKRKKSISKSTTEKTISSKSKTAGRKPSKTAASEKSGVLKSQSPKQKQSKAVKKDLKTVSKSKDLKSSKKTPIAKRQTSKITGTPKLSKSTKAGARLKTAAVRKLVKSID